MPEIIEQAPAPTTYADWCLDRIATALEVVASLEVLARQQPAVAVDEGTLLPDDLPGREALAAAGIGVMEKLPRKAAALEALGLDSGTIGRLLTWLKVNG